MDRLLRWIKDIQRAAYFDIQNVSDYFWQDEKEFWDLNDFNLAPPFNFFTTRYTLPPEIYSRERGHTDFGSNAGGEILTVFRLVDGLPRYHQHPAGGKEANTADRITLPGAKWYYDIFLFPVKGRQAQLPSYYLLAVDDRGQVAYQPNGIRAFFTARFYKEFPVQILPVSFLHVSGLALTFLHCKNVEIINPPPPAKKRLPRKQKFESRYHRLKVNAINQRREQPIGRHDPTGINQSLHIVRGHFREYGPDYGKGLLFGKYSGRFWMASHFKGSASTGIVAKDYEVNPPINNPIA